MIEQHTPQRADLELDFDAILTRQRAMVEAGTHPMIADRLARDAEQNQHLRAKQLKLAATIVREPMDASMPAVLPEIVPVGAQDNAPDLHA